MAQEILIIVFASLFIFVIIIAVINLLFIYQKKQLQYIRERETTKMQHANELLQTQVEIQEHTLKNVAQEIHDNIGQILILAKLNLNTFPPLHDEATETKVNDTRRLVAKAINDLRDLSKSLHGEKIAELGLPESISNELKILQNTGLYQTSLAVEGSKYRLPAQNEMVLFRIVQESLHNSLKHAKAKNITVHLLYEPALFQLKISDDGEGFKPAALQAANTGIGLKNMRDRAALIGGKFLIQSSPGNGTFISVTIENPNPHP